VCPVYSIEGKRDPFSLDSTAVGTLDNKGGWPTYWARLDIKIFFFIIIQTFNRRRTSKKRKKIYLQVGNCRYEREM
jgi:hypothetical protein